MLRLYKNSRGTERSREAESPQPKRPLKVGIVCPYAWDVPGGVQIHVRDLAEHLQAQRNADGAEFEVSVLAPSRKESELPDYVTRAGGSMGVHYNGSTARLALSPRTILNIRQWLRRSDFDVVHVHEPANPSLSLVTCLLSAAPLVATFHTSGAHFRALNIASPIVKPLLDRIRRRIAVSSEAQRTMSEYVGGKARIIPNGVDVAFFAGAKSRPEWEGVDASGGTKAPTLAFVGRLDEPRKGLAVLLNALPGILEKHPTARLLVAGGGDAQPLLDTLPAKVRGQIALLGRVSDEDKARLLRSADLFVAPNTGGESFGIILAEAMAAGVPVLASNLKAFEQVLDGGQVGELFPVSDSKALAQSASALLDDAPRRAQLSNRGAAWVQQYDWGLVADEIRSVYDQVIDRES